MELPHDICKLIVQGRGKEHGTSIKIWLFRCVKVHEEHGSEFLVLVFVASNTEHWKRYAFSNVTVICFLYDTCLKFLENGKNGSKGAPMEGKLIYHHINPK